jgi:hypothetical protein
MKWIEWEALPLLERREIIEDFRQDKVQKRP